MAENGNGKRKKNLSPETRDKLSRLAKERHAKGIFGGSEFGKLGGRPKNEDRVSKSVAEAAQEEENRRLIIEVFKDAIHPNQQITTRMRGAMAWLEVEGQESKLVIQEAEADARNHSREELIEILTEKLTSGPAAEILRSQLSSGEVINGDATEIP